MYKFPRSETPSAFTLIELLVVVVIIAVLAGISLPIYSSVRSSADKTTCTAHLKQIIAASNLAANDNNGFYPNMHGYTWEAGSVWVSDALAPYVGGTVGQDPTKLLRCPAAEKNPQESWLEASQYGHYRFNVAYGQNKKPLVGYVNAMMFFDTTYPDWTATQVAHTRGGGPLVNVAYADGHVASLAYADYKTLDPSTDDTQNDFFRLGWIK